MVVKDYAVTDLITYGNNPRINDAAVDAVVASIKEFGFKVPIIVDKNNVIVAGHTRLRAAKLLGLEKVPVIVADDLTEEQIKAFRLADNKTAEFAEWDYDKLKEELKNITLDMEQFGFEEAEEVAEEITIPPEVKFTEELEEEHNYVVLYFKNNIDWLQAQTLFGLTTVKNFTTNKNVEKSKTEQKGVGRVVDGIEALRKAGII